MSIPLRVELIGVLAFSWLLVLVTSSVPSGIGDSITLVGAGKGRGYINKRTSERAIIEGPPAYCKDRVYNTDDAYGDHIFEVNASQTLDLSTNANYDGRTGYCARIYCYWPPEADKRASYVWSCDQFRAGEPPLGGLKGKYDEPWPLCCDIRFWGNDDVAQVIDWGSEGHGPTYEYNRTNVGEVNCTTTIRDRWGNPQPIIWSGEIHLNPATHNGTCAYLICLDTVYRTTLCDQFDFRTGDQKGEYDQDYDKCCDIRQTITPGIN